MKQLFEDLLTDTSILLADELYTAINASNLQKTTSILIDFWGDEFDQVETAYKINSTESIWKTIEKKFGNSVKSILHCIVETRKYETKQEYPIKGRGDNYSINKPMYFATLIHDELHKELIDSLSVQRLFIFRSEAVKLDLFYAVCDLHLVQHWYLRSNYVLIEYLLTSMMKSIIKCDIHLQNP
uniref:Uncharacterized protein n=1 Tax=Schistosoma haematobium TaxID=6185 RepID=A0A095A3L0_SCHHA